MATLDLLPHISLDYYLAVRVVYDSQLGVTDGSISIKHNASVRKQAIRQKKRGELLQGMEEQYKTRGGG